MWNQSIASTVAFWLGSALLFAAAGYAVAALGAVYKSLRARETVPGDGACPCAVSVLKPLNGAEPGLYENLRSFCVQRHDHYQLVFGVREASDPAIEVVKRLRTEFPQLDIQCVVEAGVYGANLKVSNLLNMLPHARHDWLVLADSDISVPSDYLARVTAPLADRRVGIVTCLYYGVPRGGFWSRLGCLFIDDWFAPSVRLAHACGSRRFAFGSTIALRRESLQAIGGFEALSDVLADDFWLGELTRQAGLQTVLSGLMVGTDVSERRLSELWTHELRWLRTIRSLAPAGFAMSFVCFTWPVSLLGLWLAPTSLNLCVALAAGLARGVQFFLGRSVIPVATTWFEVLLTPVRDLLLLLEWMVALTGWRVKWRGQVMHARKDGSVRYP
ncbi:bacteriohopanetetrol glucosamine biosynthesis glycosyltransferase HpnI [Pseudomonas sp. NPDC090202]|uniref:bacteriohopanetetrol glucosamine biosynthesis glycosyltransferase HpnI n=1 Tax=unclassified Pseudomonas TaxID=196821 RepID=UPI0038020199